MGCFVSKDKVRLVQVYYIIPARNICCIKIKWDGGKNEEFINLHEVLILKLLILTNHSTVSTPVYYIGINESSLNIPYHKREIIIEDWINLYELLSIYTHKTKPELLMLN
jgi:hypothetical protein